MAATPSAFGKVLQLQRSQGEQKGKQLLWQHLWQPIFHLPLVQNNSFQQVPAGGGEGLTPAQQLHLANLLSDFGGKRKQQPIKRLGACVIRLKPGWNNKKAGTRDHFHGDLG